MRLFKFFLILLLPPFLGYTTPIQIFLEPVAEPICDVPLEIKTYILNEEGNVVSTYNGKKRVKISVKEQGEGKTNNVDIPTKYIRFKKGVGSFFLKAQDEGTLEIKVEVEGIRLPGYMSLTFKKRDIKPPFVEAIFVEKHNILVLKFNEVIEEESALKVENYKALTDKREVYPKKVEYHKDYVILEFPENFESDEEGYIEIEGIKDLSGNEIPMGSRSPKFKGDCGC